MRTPDSERLINLTEKLTKLLGEYQVLASEVKPDHEDSMLAVCDILSDAQHKARRVVRVMEL